MKITKRQLRRIIKEEKQKFLKEAYERSIVVVHEDAFKSLYDAHKDLQLLAQHLEKGGKDAEAAAVGETANVIAAALADLKAGSEISGAITYIHMHDPYR